jgi:hypothetical protein
MRASRRRQRTLDPLASPAAVHSICDKLRARLPDLIPTSEKQLMRFLYSVRHVERRPATDTLRGRPSHWPREKLTEAASVLRGLLERETSSRVSVNSFIGQYIPVLNFPADVTGALSKGEINLHEATQLARLTSERLDATPARARLLRAEVLLAHTLARGSQNALRTRVKEILGEVVTVSGKEMAGVVEKVDELLEIDPSDKRHLFYEELKRFFYAMRETRPEDIDDDSLDEFMTAADQLSNALYRIELKRRQREKSARKMQL